MNGYQERIERTKQFRYDRFGMFIHWGIYAVHARGEWAKREEKITDEDYQKYFDEFNPTDYNPKEWAKLAKKAGMKYAVLTTKHHDGFCLFDSKYTDYKATNTKAGRDLVREYVDAFREQGIKIGFYYSLLDWHHPDYPKYNDRLNPMFQNEAFKNHKPIFNNYIEYFHNQVRELLTNYGKIDIMWFDFSYDNCTGEYWKASELIKIIRELQPDIIINDRLGGKVTDKEPTFIAGDYVSPEQIIPNEPIVDELGRRLAWEECLTLNENWGYCSSDNQYKTPQNVIRTLVNIVSKGGNMLINVGPDAKGRIPKRAMDILSQVGEWMELNSESIYGCDVSDFEKPEWGRYTQNGDRLFAHIFERGIGDLRFCGLEGKVKSAKLLADGSELQLFRPWNSSGYPDDAFINIKNAVLPDQNDTVIEFKLS